ncbi:MAG: translation initiation factor 2 [Desulfovibrio sp.]|jgi:hypothetical protein|nr:translation initiation factor 2 [Desulfovibrio sp.]
MRLLPAILLLTLAGGCASTSAQTEQESVAVPPAQQEAEQTKPAAPTGKTKEQAVKTPRGAKTEAVIRAELETTGRKLAAQAARTLRPSKAEKEVKKEGNEFVATYLEIDAATLSTEMRPGSSAGHYVGFVRYQERIFECRGASRQAALSAPCRNLQNRRINELIRYDGKAWQM